MLVTPGVAVAVEEVMLPVAVIDVVRDMEAEVVALYVVVVRSAVVVLVAVVCVVELFVVVVRSAVVVAVMVRALLPR